MVKHVGMRIRQASSNRLCRQSVLRHQQLQYISSSNRRRLEDKRPWRNVTCFSRSHSTIIIHKPNYRNTPCGNLNLHFTNMCPLTAPSSFTDTGTRKRSLQRHTAGRIKSKTVCPKPQDNKLRRSTYCIKGLNFTSSCDSCDGPLLKYSVFICGSSRSVEETDHLESTTLAPRSGVSQKFGKC